MDKAGNLETRKKSKDIGVKVNKLNSSVWETFLLIFDRRNNKKFLNFVKCSKCSKFGNYNGFTTTRLMTHKCTKVQTIESFLTSETTNLSKHEIDRLRDAATEFIVWDIRPLYTLEGEGLRNLLKPMIHVGKKYLKLNADIIERLIPSRYSMFRYTDKKAIDAIENFKANLAKSIQSVGGFSCTLDSYSDRYRCNTYLGITARLNIIEGENLEQKEYVISLNHID